MTEDRLTMQNVVFCPLPSVFRHLEIVLLIKEDLELHSRSRACGSDDFAGYHNRLFGPGKLECHGDLLTDRERLGGFNENSGTTDILNRCIKFGIGCFAVYDDGLIFLK